MTYESLRGRSALVTGAASGNGLATSRRLEAEGVTVAYVDINAAALEKVDAGKGAVKLVADISTEDGTQRLAEEFAARFEELDVLVNNAGIVRFSHFESLPLDEWEQVMRVNVTGALLVTQQFTPLLRRTAARRGDAATASVVNITSLEATRVVSRVGHPQVHYNASKGALKMLTKALALELAPSNIRVNAVAPGFVVTPFTAESLADPAVVSWALERIPLKRLAMPEDVAAAVAFLASEESSYMTGAELAVDGGWSAQ
jgi:NAD(P)-dependent dehydrogenase (short-subunit alcohol dehydrogenase family)